jgi:hypothetical protein
MCVFVSTMRGEAHLPSPPGRRERVLPLREVQGQDGGDNPHARPPLPPRPRPPHQALQVCRYARVPRRQTDRPRVRFAPELLLDASVQPLGGAPRSQACPFVWPPRATQQRLLGARPRCHRAARPFVSRRGIFTPCFLGRLDASAYGARIVASTHFVLALRRQA